MRPNRATRHQEIWKRTKNGLKIDIPKIINTDIGFQLMFGYREDNRVWSKKVNENADKYYCKVYNDKYHAKEYIK